MAKANAAAVVLPWMVGSREDRKARLRAFYEARGDKKAAQVAGSKCDDVLANLCGECGPILEELYGGVSVADLAGRWGVTEMAVYAHLLKYAPEEFRELSANRALGRRRELEEKLAAADDNVKVSKFKALLSSAEWELERVAPKVFGTKQGGEGLSITVNVDRSCGGAVVLDAARGGVSQRLTISGAEASASAGS